MNVTKKQKIGQQKPRKHPGYPTCHCKTCWRAIAENIFSPIAYNDRSFQNVFSNWRSDCHSLSIGINHSSRSQKGSRSPDSLTAGHLKTLPYKTLRVAFQGPAYSRRALSCAKVILAPDPSRKRTCRPKRRRFAAQSSKNQGPYLSAPRRFS